MRRLSLIVSGLLVAGIASAQSGFAPAAAELQPHAEITGGPQTKVALWIWSDKYTYQADQPLTLRWTVKTNNDLYPYTVFVYRQNNQTGAKTYYPGVSSSPTDINGNTLAQGFQPAPLSDQTKAVLLGGGGIAPAVAMPNELGMHTFVVELRDYTGTRPLKTAYMKVGVVTGTQTITGNITASRTLTNDTQWNLSGVVYVKDGAVLTIQPGTFIFGQPGTPPNVSVLVIARTATIEAHGTKSRPIVFSSSQPFGQRTRGDWGGVILLGRAPVNLAAGAQFNNPAAGEGYIEGLQTSADGLYGGSDPTHYCGTLTYVRSEFAGTILSTANEVNSFTWGGCGTKTVAHHLQANYGGDDAFEWFGGTMNTSHLVGGLNADDCLDYQLGTTGKVQYAICYQSPDANGARGIEGDNSQFNELASPFSDPVFYNVSLIGIDATATEDGPTNGIHVRRGARGTFNNFVVTRWRGPGMLLNDTNTQTQATNGFIKVNGLLLWNARLDTSLGGSSGAGQTLANNITANTSPSAAQTFTLNFLNGTPAGAAQNTLVADPLLTRPFEFSDPDFFGMFGSPVFRTGWVAPPDDGFYDQTARFIGGIGDIDWTREWTSWLVETDIRN